MVTSFQLIRKGEHPKLLKRHKSLIRLYRKPCKKLWTQEQNPGEQKLVDFIEVMSLTKPPVAKQRLAISMN